MLPERKAEAFYYDGVTDVARIFVAKTPGTVRTRTAEGVLLLDANGFLVGVDVDPGLPDRVVVMLGPHEAVARTAAAKVSVSTDASATVYEVRIRGAREAIRAKEKNPYI